MTPKKRVDAALCRGRQAREFEAALAEAEAAVVPALVEPMKRRKTNAQERREQARKDDTRERRERNEAKGIKYIQLSDGRWVIPCKGRNFYNEPCKSMVVRKGKVLKAEGIEDCVATGGFCLRHDPKVSDEYMYSIRKHGGRKRTAAPDEYLREVITQAVGLIVRPYFDGLGVRMNKATGEITRVPGGGVKIHGESKDGDINMTKYEDSMSQAKLSEMLLDRAFGRPRTQAEVSFTPTGQSAQVPPTAERAREVALVLAEAEAIPNDDDEEEDEAA